VVLRGTHGQIVEPVASETFPVEWVNAAGAYLRSQGVKATFDLAALPDGDLTVLVSAHGQSRTYTIPAKDRSKLR
jgi:hypothetical protein